MATGLLIKQQKHDAMKNQFQPAAPMPLQVAASNMIQQCSNRWERANATQKLSIRVALYFLIAFTLAAPLAG